MADNTEVIRSFLLSVGIQADEKGLKTFDQTIGRITKTVTEFAVAMAAAAAAVSASVLKISSEFEDLYYASQRLRSSVDNIKAFSFGVSQMGGNAAAARQSLEAFSSFLRSNPMGEGYIRGLGVETRDAAGNAREYADVLRDLGAQLRKMPYWAARQRANMLGIDENTLQALLRGTDLWSERYRKLVADSGVDMDQMSKDLTNLQQQFRLLRAEIEVRFYKALSRVDPKILQAAAAIGAVAGALGLVAAILGPVAAGVTALAASVALLADDFEGWREGSDSLVNWAQWSDEIDKAMEAIGELGAAIKDLGDALAPVAEWMGRVFGPAVNVLIAIVTTSIKLLSDSIRVVVDLLRMDWTNAWKDAGKTAKDAMSGVSNIFDKMGKEWAAATGKSGAQPATGPSAQARSRALSGAANDNRTPAQRGSAADAIAYFMRQGWTREQAAGIVANLQHESGMNSSAVGDSGSAYGVAQWHGDRQAAFKAWAGHDIRNSTLAEQLAFVNYELTRGSEQAAGRQLRRANTAGQAGAVVSSAYERPADRLGAMADRGRTAEGLLGGPRLGSGGGATVVNIHAPTNVKVQGVADAQATGKAVGDSIDRRNSDLVRNTKGAIR